MLQLMVNNHVTVSYNCILTCTIAQIIFPLYCYVLRILNNADHGYKIMMSYAVLLLSILVCGHVK